MSTAITLNITTDPITFTSSGQKITYIYTVTNIGGASLSGDIILNDSLFGETILSVDKLEMSALLSYQQIYTTTNEDVESKSINNVAIARCQNLISNVVNGEVVIGQSTNLVFISAIKHDNKPSTYIVTFTNRGPDRAISPIICLLNQSSAPIIETVPTATTTNDDLVTISIDDLSPGDFIQVIVSYSVVEDSVPTLVYIKSDTIDSSPTENYGILWLKPDQNKQYE